MTCARKRVDTVEHEIIEMCDTVNCLQSHAYEPYVAAVALWRRSESVNYLHHPESRRQ